MKLWITGAKGLLGSALLKKMPDALGTSREVDIGDLEAVRAFVKKQPGITHIVNCAAFSLVDLAETNRGEATSANAIGPENLAVVAREIGARLVHISTDYVFPGNVQRPLREKDVVGPCNHYGMTKLIGELRVQKEMPDACIIRTSWIFGNAGKNFVAKLFQLLQSEKEIRLTNDQWGRPTYVNDLADAVVKMLDCKGLYHFANSGIATKYDFGCLMREECIKIGVPVKTSIIHAVPGSTFASPCKRPAYSAFDTSKIERELTVRSWQEALREHLCEFS